MQLAAVLAPAEEGVFVALNPETGTTSQGETIEAAIANPMEETSHVLEDFRHIAAGHPVVTVFTVPEPALCEVDRRGALCCSTLN